MANLSDKIFVAILIFFHVTGISLFRLTYQPNGRTTVHPSKFAILVSICAFLLISYSIVVNFHRHTPGASSFIASDSTELIAGFLRLMTLSKAIVVFIPLWVFYRHGKLIYEYSIQVNDIVNSVNPSLTYKAITAPTVKKTCALIMFMVFYAISQLTFMFTKMSRFDKSWVDWSMIICMVAPNGYAIFCIVHLYFSLTLLSERIKQVNALLKDVCK